jgi:hypothetical protein
MVGRTGCVRQLTRMSSIDGLDAQTRSCHCMHDIIKEEEDARVLATTNALIVEK